MTDFMVGFGATLCVAVLLVLGTASSAVLPIVAIVSVGGAFLVARPHWLVPAFIALTWMSIDQSLVGRWPSPVEVGGLVLLCYATWQAVLRPQHARETLIVCALVALPLIASALVSPAGASIPSDQLKNVAFIFIVALSARSVSDVDRVPTALAILGILLGAGALYSVLVHPTALFPVTPDDVFEQPPSPIADLPRAAGPFGEPNFFGLGLAALVPMALYLVAKSAKHRILGICATAFLLAGVLATGSRGALLAAGFAMIATALVMHPLRIPAIITIAVAPGLLLVPALRAQTGTYENRSVEGRATENLVAIEMFKDHPLTGVGTGHYPYFYRDYSRRVGNDTRVLRAPHSLPLEIAAEQGVVGIAGWIVAAIVVARFVFVRRVWSVLLGRALVLSTLTYLVGSIFLHGSQLRLLYMLVGLLLASGWSRPQRDTEVA